jgi:hypothetical protein
MAQKDTQAGKLAASYLFPAGLAEFSQKRVEVMMDLQKGLFDEIQEINRHLLDRTKSETDLTAELVNKLTAARSVPEALTAWQQWASRQMEMAAEDSQWTLSNSFKLMEAGARLFSNGRAGAGSAAT